jgi:hypothetical protein
VRRWPCNAAKVFQSVQRCHGHLPRRDIGRFRITTRCGRSDSSYCLACPTRFWNYRATEYLVASSSYLAASTTSNLMRTAALVCIIAAFAFASGVITNPITMGVVMVDGTGSSSSWSLLSYCLPLIWSGRMCCWLFLRASFALSVEDAEIYSRWDSSKLFILLHQIDIPKAHLVHGFLWERSTSPSSWNWSWYDYRFVRDSWILW